MATALGINYADIILNEDIKKKKTFTKSLDISINERTKRKVRSRWHL